MSDATFPWHRVFHPLCGADPLTLAHLVRRNGPPSLKGLPAFAVACATSLLRLPFTLAELGLDAASRAPAAAPVFILGFPRSGTTHLHNLLAATGAFATAPPVLATLPWESRTLGPLMKPFVDPFLPRTRLIDGVAMDGDAPTEDEVGLANLGPGSYFHALYFPKGFERAYREGLLAPARDRQVTRYVAAMARRDSRPLLLKNPAYTAQVGALARLFPGARFVHIHRDPRAVFASSRRALRRTLDALALQDSSGADIDGAILRTYPAVMRALRDQAAALPPGQMAEVAFEDVVADPKASLRRLARGLRLPDVEGEGVAAHLNSVSGFQPEGGRLPPDDEARLEAAWAPEIARYGRA
jgi:hypothetical protein